MIKKNNKNIVPNDSFNEILLYTGPGGKVKVEIFLHNENIWLTQARIAELFGVKRPAITKHLKNIFGSGELDEKLVSSILEHTTQHGAIKGKTQTQAVRYYNLDAIISVGYRVNSTQATHFRIWATERLKEYIIKGYTMEEWKEKLDAFLKFGEHDILDDPGIVSNEIAKTFAETEFEKYRVLQDTNYISDFDEEVKKILGKKQE